MNAKRAIPLFILFAVVQFLLYATYIHREVEWNYILHGDPTWYVYYNYKMFHAVVERDWGIVWEQAVTSPWGVLLYLEALIPQFLFGPSRFSVGSINLVYFLIAQAAVYIFFSRLTRNTAAGLLAVVLLLAMQTPFRGDGPGLNIADFHFDLVLFYLLIILHLMVAWSNSFDLRKASLLIGAMGGITVATRLVSFFLLGGVFGAFGLFLIYRWLRDTNTENPLSRRRVINFSLAAITFLVTSAIPIAIAGRALASHYFRFLFDEQFIEERANLYVMGASSKFSEAYEVAARMVKYDFGLGYLAVAFIIVLAFAIGWILLRSNGKTHDKFIDTAPPLTGTSNMLPDTEARKTYLIFLLISTIASYVMHVAFPIKSDHLTRMTAAPIYIAIAFWLAPILAARLSDHRLRMRILARTATSMVAAVAIFVQLSFYTGPGRDHERKLEISKIQDLYADISRLVSAMELNEITLSVDHVTDFELGAMLSFAVYDFEHNGRFLVHHPGLGGVIDSPIDLDHSVQLLHSSDFVLLGTPPTQPGLWPFNKSLLPISDAIHKYVNESFCHAGDYMIFGKSRQLFVRRTLYSWSYKASASTEAIYGPQGLLEGRSRIWHAPWGGKTPQWVEFTQPTPVKFSKITIVAQDKAPTRAPRDFVLQALDPKSGWVQVLSVTGADFSTSQSLSWDVALSREYSSFRLVVSKNNGDPNFMTIQAISLDMHSDSECAQVAKISRRALKNTIQ